MKSQDRKHLTSPGLKRSVAGLHTSSYYCLIIYIKYMKFTPLYGAGSFYLRVEYKYLLALKLIALLLLSGALHVSAASYSQNITMSAKGTTVESVLRSVRQQTGYLFFYSEKVNVGEQRFDVSFKNTPLRQVLNESLAPAGLDFEIVGKTIVISNKPTVARQNLVSQPAVIKGQVKDSVNNFTLPGVTVSMKSPRKVLAVSDGNGNFVISAKAGDVIIFSYIGYTSKEVKLGSQLSLGVNLVPEVASIKDVVITGYQSIKRDNYTGNAIIVSGADLKRNNPQNLLKSIQSFDPSFRLLENNMLGSDPNRLPQINVRGATAIPSISDDILDRNNLSSNYNLPVFIMDGFEVSMQKVYDLDINRIESVTLLKDGAATAVYGSRAANGVMVITTKTPAEGKLQLSYNYENTFSAPDLSDYHVLDAQQKITYEQKVGLYSSSMATSGDTKQEELDAQLFTRLKNVASGVNSYWLSQPLRNVYQQKHSLYVQGGEKTFRYGIDLRYQTQPGVMKGSDNKRYSGGLDFTYTPHKGFIVRNVLTVTQVDQKNSPYGNFSEYVYANPYFPLRDSTGRLLQELANWRVDTDRQGADQYVTEIVFNPLYEASLSSFNKSAYTEIINALSADYKITPELRLRALVSLNKTNGTSDNYLSPLSSKFYNVASDKLNTRGSYDYGTNANLNIDGNITLGYNKQINEHFMNLVIGANILAAKSDQKSFSAQGFASDAFTNIGFARIYKENDGPNGNVIKQRTAGLFFSGNYAFRNRYLLDASVRIDGSSAFGADKRYAPFWSLGAGWNIHKESFLANSSVISQLRLKGSIATLGSINFQPYQARALYAYQSSNWYSTGIGASIIGFGNNKLEWQKTYTYDAGIDLGMFDDRLVISPRYYVKNTKGLITDINLAPSTGYTTYKDNLGDMSNKGYELYVTANVLRRNNWNVNLTGNLTHNDNKIVSISDALKSFNGKIDSYQTNTSNNAFSTPLARYVEGKSLNTIWAVRSLGIDPQNGKEILMKKDGSLTYDWDVRDIEDVGNRAPAAEGFFGSTISYKRLMFSFNFHYRFGGDTFNQTLIDRVENANPRFNVDSRVLSDRWQQAGDHTFFKNIADVTQTYVSSRFVQKDRLLELQSVYVSYDWQGKMIQSLGIKNLRLAATANDIFRTSSIEAERGINYPFARSVTFSLLGSF